MDTAQDFSWDALLASVDASLHGRRTQPPCPGLSALRRRPERRTRYFRTVRSHLRLLAVDQSVLGPLDALAEDALEQASDAATPGTIAICADRLAAELQHVSLMRVPAFGRSLLTHPARGCSNHLRAGVKAARHDP